MIKNELNAVAEFHNAFGIESADSPIANIPSQTILLRYNLMKEENEEYLDAAQKTTLLKLQMLWETCSIFCVELYSLTACNTKSQRFLMKFKEVI